MFPALTTLAQHDAHPSASHRSTSPSAVYPMCSAAPPFGDGLARSLIFAADCFLDRIDSYAETALVILFTKVRRDPILANVIGDRIGQRSLKAVADLDRHFVVSHKDEKGNAVAFVFLAYPPGLRDALGVIFDRRVALHLWEYSNDDLVGRFPLELLKLCVEPKGCFGRNDVSVVVEITVGFWRDDFRGAARKGNKSEKDCGDQ